MGKLTLVVDGENISADFSPLFFFFMCRRGNESIEEWDGFRRPCFVNRYVGVCLSGMGEG